MNTVKIKKTLSVLLFSGFVGCSPQQSLFQGLDSEQDGILSVGIPQDEKKFVSQELSLQINQLSPEEKRIVDDWHEGEIDKLSFLVVDVRNKKIIRDYYSDQPRRLASISKIPTALGALENVRNVSFNKVQNMLKISNNGEASRYIRLGAKAIEGLVIPTPPYTQRHSCPSAFLEDGPAADVVFAWLQSEIPAVDWTGASLNDGAGCHYDNFMTPFQVTKILQYADGKGAIYGGQSFEDLLSINGVDGTWRNRNLDHVGYIFAKTGTLNPNANLSGYFYARRQGQLIKYYFSIFVQKRGGGQFSTRARRLIEELMRYWINYYSSYEERPLSDF